MSILIKDKITEDAGKQKDVKIFAKWIESAAMEQIQTLAKHPCIGNPIRIMPDVHYGDEAVIGFTAHVKEGIIPSVVGVDQGCGVLTAEFPCTVRDLMKLYSAPTREHLFVHVLDPLIRQYIPFGKMSHTKPLALSEDEKIICNQAAMLLQRMQKTEKMFEFKDKRIINPTLQLGTLGGGNHFIEFEGQDDRFFVTIHSGSRNFGYRTAQFFQNQALLLQKIITGKIKHPKEQECKALFKDLVDTSATPFLPFLGSEAVPEWAWGFSANAYLASANVSLNYAKMNRLRIINTIAELCHVPIQALEIRTSVHNYIDGNGIIRKGAISAYKGEKVIIPLSMKDGIILGTGKGNEDWNCSAPHGAGRIFGRNTMKQMLAEGILTMAEFEKDMQGILSTSICPSCIDESSFAYKKMDDIIPLLQETIDIEEIVKPLFVMKDKGMEHIKEINSMEPIENENYR